MFRTSFVYFLAAAALAQTSHPLPGHEISNGTGTLKSGVRIRYRSVATPDDSSINLIATGINITDSGLHRFVIDKTTSSYFGYDLVVSPPDVNNQYQAVFQPLTGVEQVVASLSGNPSLKPMMLPKYPAPQMVRAGDLIALDLMVSADGTRKLTDYVEVLAPTGAPAMDPGVDPQDFTVDDGPVKFDGPPVDLWINGQAREFAFTGRAGATFWIAVPGRGRSIVSLTPHDGFTKSGTVHGDTMSFEDGGQRFAVRFEKAIAGRGKAWNLYIHHDMNYSSQDMVSAGTDRLDSLLKNR